MYSLYSIVFNCFNVLNQSSKLGYLGSSFFVSILILILYLLYLCAVADCVPLCPFDLFPSYFFLSFILCVASWDSNVQWVSLLYPYYTIAMPLGLSPSDANNILSFASTLKFYGHEILFFLRNFFFFRSRKETISQGPSVFLLHSEYIYIFL